MKHLLLAVCLFVSFVASAQQVQFYSMTEGCSIKLYLERSGNDSISLPRTERSRQFTDIREGLYSVTIKCNNPHMLMVQVIDERGSIKPLFDRSQLKVWDNFVVAKPGEKYIYTPFTESVKCLTCTK